MGRACADQSKRPCLKLKAIFFGQYPGGSQIGGFADHVVGLRDVVAVRVFEPMSNEADSEVRNVDPDPSPFELLRRGDARSASAEWVADHVAFVAARVDNAIE